MSSFLELEKRRNIYNLIKKNPGLHLSKISELLNIRISLIEYHLATMERMGVISCVKEKGYIRYYVAGKIGSKDKKILSILRQEIPLKIVLFLLKNPHSRHRDILKELKVARSTLTYHVHKLIKNEIIDVHETDEEKTFKIRDEKKITSLLIKYKPYNVIESFKDVWVDLQVD